MDIKEKVSKPAPTRIRRASPAEAAGSRPVIRYGFHLTPFGLALIGLAERGICWLAFADGSSRRDALGQLSTHWSGVPLRRDQEGTAGMVEDLFSRPARADDHTRRPAARRGAGAAPRFYLRGTDFQIRVWDALLSTAPGETTTYGKVAARIGDPSAQRAVGAAVGSNPVAYGIPCHRVIRASGALGGYRWGLDRKRAMLDWEAQARPRSASLSRSHEA